MINFGWRPAFFTVNLFYNYQRLTLSLQALFVHLACLVASKMIALQESSYRKENRIWLLLARKKIIKKAANNVSVRGSFSPFFFLFVSCQFNFSLPLCSSRFLFLITFIFTLDPQYTILTVYINTTLLPSFKFDESFSGLKISCHFLIRKPRSI